MGPLEVLDRLDNLVSRGATVTVEPTPDGLRLRVAGPQTTELASLAPHIRRHRGMIINAYLGRTVTGHALAPCSVCGEVSMTAVLASTGKPRKDHQWPRCRFTPRTGADTPGCPGRHVARASDLERIVRRAPPAQAKPPPSRSKQRTLTVPSGAAYPPRPVQFKRPLEKAS